MIADPRCLRILAFLCGISQAARSPGRVSPHAPTNTKFIADVPVVNYHLAHKRKSSFIDLDSLQEEWVVVLQPGTVQEDIDRLCAFSHCSQKGHAEGFAYLVTSGTEANLYALVESAHDAIKYVEPDTEVSVIPDQVETETTHLWGLSRVGAHSRDAEGAGVAIFVVDTGVRTTHEDFGGRAVPTLDLTSGHVVECDGDVECAADRQGHGTHCAGTAAGSQYGVAPAATLHSVKVLGDSGSGRWSWSCAALDWIASSSIRPAVTSMSLGGSGNQRAMKDAIDVATKTGVIVVVAAGNSDSDACRFSPAYVPSAITVGATDSTSRRSTFSNHGPCADIWAPGSLIRSAGHASDSASRTLSGTSMACPHVAGGAALLLQKNPDSDSQKVLRLLRKNAIDYAISHLTIEDTNKFLYVGSGGPSPTKTPVSVPPAPILIESQVRVKASVPLPKYGWGRAAHGSVGVVTELVNSTTCKVDFPAQSGWLAATQELELATNASAAPVPLTNSSPEPTPMSRLPMRVGSRVRVKALVKHPRHGWGSVAHTSVGLVNAFVNSTTCKVDFPEQRGWWALIEDIELAGDVTSAPTPVMTPSSTPETALPALIPDMSMQTSPTTSPASIPRSPIKVSSRVHVRAQVETPKYGWGKVTRKSIGLVTAVVNSTTCKVDFPEQAGWWGFVEDIESAVYTMPTPKPRDTV